MAWFQFKASALSQSIRVEWPADLNMAVIDSATALLMVRRGYADHPTDEQLAAYNAVVDGETPPSESSHQKRRGRPPKGESQAQPAPEPTGPDAPQEPETIGEQSDGKDDL